MLGRLLFRVRDRLDPAFGDPPADADLELELLSGVGRVRLGPARAPRVRATTSDRQRRLYQFRTRHGFTDAADAAFDALWAGDGLTWADIERLSAEALAPATV